MSIGGPRQQRLMALLAVRTGSVADIDWIGENLWSDGDRPDDPEGALRTYVSRLRRSLPSDVDFALETVPGGYRLSAPSTAVEHLRFSELRARARKARERQDPAAALNLLDEALGLWRGDPFPELEDLPWALAEIERLRQERLEALEERFEVALALGRHTQIIGQLAAFTAEHGLRERAWRQYALALHRSDRTAEALRTIQRYREELLDLSGLDPSPAMQALERQLLEGDPGLDAVDGGRPLRGYRLLEQIGSGAFSLVWRAVQPSVDREVAIKQIRAELATQPEFIRRFEAEAQLIARIEHPHVVPLIDYWRDPDSAYLVMRCLRGGTLEASLDDGPWPVDRTLAMAAQVGEALGAAHARGVIHRDVKPANILFDEQNNAYLSDFGIALEAVDTTGPAAALSRGSPVYAAPEQLRKERLGPAADVFSLAVVVFECLAGTVPFPDEGSADELIRRQIHDPFPPLSSVRVDVPASVGTTVARATAKDPIDRFDTVAEFLEALQRPTTSTSVGPKRGGSTVITGPVSNPYVGLRAFAEADAEHYFGRDRLVAEVLDRFRGGDVSSRCVVLVGPSGSGKSSVARAGVVPAVRAGDVTGSEAWFTTTLVPGPDPFEALEAALLRVAVNPPPALLGQLRDGPRGIVRGVNRCVASNDDRVLVVIDQFEELFTHGDAAATAAFLTALAVAVEEPSTPLRLVCTLRADFYDHPLRHPAFARVLKASAVDVTPLAPDELEEAITGPASQLGVSFEGALVTRLAAEALGQPAPLPMLQHTLAELFDRRVGTTITSGAYDDVGGLAGALAARAENLYASCSEGEQQAARRVFGRLADPRPGRGDLRRRVALDELGDDPATRSMIERFVAGRLLTRDRDPFSREPTIEVAHEALLREWPRLDAWLAQDRALLGRIDTLRSAADRWADGGRQEADLLRGTRLDAASELVTAADDRLRPVDRDLVATSLDAAAAQTNTDRRRHRRLRRLMTATAAALAVALVAAAVAVVQRGRANDEAAAAEAAAAAADVQTLISRSAATAADDPTLSILLALEAHRRDPDTETESAVLASLVGLGARTSVHQPLVDEGEVCDTDGLVSADGRSQFATLGGRMVIHDIRSDRSTDLGPHPFPCGVWVGSQRDARFFAADLPPAPMELHFGRFTDDGPETDTVIRPDRHITKVIYDQGTGERAWVVSGTDRDGSGQLHDTISGEPVGPPLPGLVYGSARFSDDSALLVVSTAGNPDLPEGGGPLRVIDARTGAVRWQTELESRAVAFDVDLQAGHVLVGTVQGRIITLALADGSVLFDVPGPSTDILSIDVGSDGRLAASSEGALALVDRATGPIPGTATPLRNGAGGALADDGTYVVHYQDHHNEVFDLDGGAIATASHETPQVGYKRASAGALAAVDDTTGEVEVIALDTGERNRFALRDENGSRFLAVAASPQSPQSVLAFSIDLTLGSWEDGAVVGTARPDVRAGTALSGGDGQDGKIVLVGIRAEDASASAHLYDVSGPPTVLNSVELGGVADSGFPAPDDGMYVMMRGGELRHYDASGNLLDSIPTDRCCQRWVAGDLASDRLVFGGAQGISWVDLSTDEVHHLDTGNVVDVAMVPGGERIIVATRDGVHRLWDLDDGAELGVLFEGTANSFGRSAIEGDGRHAWLNTQARVVRVPIVADEWIEQACGVAGRELTDAEWAEHVPGDSSQEPVCP